MDEPNTPKAGRAVSYGVLSTHPPAIPTSTGRGDRAGLITSHPDIQDGPEKRMTLLVQIRGISAERFVHGGFFIKNERLRKEWREFVRRSVPRLCR